MASYKGAESVIRKTAITGNLNLAQPVNVSIDVGDLVLVVVVYAASGTGPTVSDAGGNTYTTYINNTQVFLGGNYTSTFYTVATTSVASGNNIVLNFASSATGVVASVHIFSPDSGTSFSTPGNFAHVNQSGTGVSFGFNANNITAGSVIVASGLLNGPNGDTWTEDTDTFNGSWSSGKSVTGPSVTNGTTGGSATSNFSIRQQYKLVTGSSTTQAWDPTWGTSRSYGVFLFWMSQQSDTSISSDPFGMLGFFGM